MPSKPASHSSLSAKLAPIRLRALFRRFFLSLTLASLLPFTVVGVGAALVFGGILYQKSEEHQHALVESHAAIVRLFLAERQKALTLLSSTTSRDDVTQEGRISQLLEQLNRAYPGSFQDLGVIDRDGRHLAYAGPYELLDKNYAEAPWFREVTEKGVYTSDVFMGFRKVPHFVMAVKHQEADGYWILRASIDSAIFGRLVAGGAPKPDGDCFLLDMQGRYQTAPQNGAALLSESGLIGLEPFQGVKTVPFRTDGQTSMLRALQWIDEPQWLLVVQQSEDSFMKPVREATVRGMAVFAVGVFIIMGVTFFSTRYLVRLVRRAIAERDLANQQFLQAGKLASIGELATGLAHEINNPLAIIYSEQTNMKDILGEVTLPTEASEELQHSIGLIRRQVERCRTITQKMLKFGRHGASVDEIIDPTRQLQDMMTMMIRQAQRGNVELRLEAEPGLPLIRIDSTELEQVLTNLVTNALQAVGESGAVVVSARAEEEGLHLTVEDTGAGIPPEVLEKIFTPFFTTKPVGKGTGLGLSVCYGIVTKWRGRIWAESPQGGGAVIHVWFPQHSEPKPTKINSKENEP